MSQHDVLRSAYQEDRWAHLVENHVGWNLSQDIANEENADNGVVLGSNESNVFLEVPQTSRSDVVSIEIVQNV